MSEERVKQRWGSTVPPRTLNVQKFAALRAPELESLHALVSDRLSGDFRCRRDKRRRTTGHDNRTGRNKYRKRRRRDGESANDKEDEEKNNNNRGYPGAGGGADKETKKSLPRRIRRRVELKKNPDTGFVTSQDGTKRLRTHVWHAKRFTMTKLWGFYLPLGLPGRGKGSRALLKRYKQRVLVHDASYTSAVQLEGPEETILSILSSVLAPSTLTHSVDCSNGGQTKCFLCGDVYGSSILHCSGAPFSQAICPVTYMWRPLPPQDNNVGVESSNTNEVNNENSTSRSRQLWLWMHISAFDEGYNVLESACQKKLDGTVNVVKCLSLEGHIAKLEVMGSKAFSLLKNMLQPCVGSLHHWNLKKCSAVETDSVSENKLQDILSEEDSYSSNAVVSLVVSDPRCAYDKMKAVLGADAAINQKVPEEENKHVSSSAGNVLKSSDSLLNLLSISESNEHSLSNCHDLWDIASGKIYRPFEECVLDTEKHHKRLSFFAVKDTGSELLKEVLGSRSCPIMLLKNTNHSDSFKGWSIILPISWVKAFWNSLVSIGGQAIGLREKRWISCDNGLPNFPSDFPDCDAYHSLKITETAASDKKLELRPPKVRPFRVPTLLPWGSSYISSRGSTQAEENCSSEDRTENSFMDVFVARTANALGWLCGEICCNQLLLSPKSTASMMDEIVQISQASGESESIVSQNKKICYLRVLLHAYKEGVFEEGAVICAPLISDISLWRSSSENSNKEKLQIPQSLLATYFKEQSCGKWEFQPPDDSPAMVESYRHPIGFVTTGFVRGSKKPLGLGLCEATWLARLRQEQMSGIKGNTRKEMFVLVRNLRSNAFRLAVASVILEKQGSDLECL